MSQADQFVITRRRKKYKFAKFAEFENCFELEEWRNQNQKLEDGIRIVRNKEDRTNTNIPILKSNSKFCIEIGAGSALFLVELAKLHPENFYIAIDIKSDRLYRGARRATEEKINNIVFVRSEIQYLTEIMPPHSADEIWLTFSDPYPRKSDAKHRLTAPRYLELYKRILKSVIARSETTKQSTNSLKTGSRRCARDDNRGGILHFKTDNRPLFDWSIAQFEQNGWQISELTRDLHSSDLPDEYKTTTSYEEKFIAEGLPIYYLSGQLLT
jgi:tRNA (guanine-N7-)-methyltransferase